MTKAPRSSQVPCPSRHTPFFSSVLAPSFTGGSIPTFAISAVVVAGLLHSEREEERKAKQCDGSGGNIVSPPSESCHEFRGGVGDGHAAEQGGSTQGSLSEAASSTTRGPTTVSYEAADSLPSLKEEVTAKVVATTGLLSSEQLMLASCLGGLQSAVGRHAMGEERSQLLASLKAVEEEFGDRWFSSAMGRQ